MRNIRTYLKWIGCCQNENKIYFLNMSFNGLFYLDLDDLLIHFVHRFSFEQANAKSLSATVTLFYENAIYFFPNQTNVIMKYDFYKKQEQVIPIQNYEEKFFVTADVVRLQDFIYMFPTRLEKGIYVFDLQKGEVKKDSELSSLFETSFPFDNNVLMRNGHCVLLGMYGSNKLIEIDLVTKKIIYSKTFEEDIHIYAVHFDGNHYWILQTESTDIYEWDRENDTLQVYRNEHAEWGKSKSISVPPIPYSNMIFLGNEILVLPFTMRSILRIEKESKTIEEPIVLPKEFRLVNKAFSGWPVCYQYTALEDKILLYPCRGNMLLVYDTITKQMTGKEMAVSEEEVYYLREILEENCMRSTSCMENDDLGTLEDFINIIGTYQNKNQFFDKKINIGQSIYQEC